MKVRGSFLSLIAYIFQNWSDTCSYRVWEEEKKHQLFGLIYRSLFCGCLFVVFNCFLVDCSRLLVVCSRLLVVCGRLLVVCGRLRSLPVLVIMVSKLNLYNSIFMLQHHRRPNGSYMNNDCVIIKYYFPEILGRKCRFI